MADEESVVLLRQVKQQSEMLPADTPGNELVIVLPKNKEHYRSGDILSGHLQLRVIDPIGVGRLSVTFSGIERIDMDETTEVRSFVRKTVRLDLERAPREVETPLLKTGIHRIPFQIALPRHLPPSYTHDENLGSIIYQVSASLKQGYGNIASPTSPNESLSSVLSSPTDDQLYHELNIEVSGSLYSDPMSELYRDLAYGGDARLGEYLDDEISIKSAVNSNFILPGGALHVRVDLDNESRDLLTNVKAKLVQLVQFRGEDDQKLYLETKREIDSVELGDVPPGHSMRQVAIIEIPPHLMESIQHQQQHQHGLKLLSIRYAVEVAVNADESSQRGVSISLQVSRGRVAPAVAPVTIDSLTIDNESVDSRDSEQLQVVGTAVEDLDSQSVSPVQLQLDDQIQQRIQAHVQHEVQQKVQQQVQQQLQIELDQQIEQQVQEQVQQRLEQYAQAQVQPQYTQEPYQVIRHTIRQSSPRSSPYTDRYGLNQYRDQTHYSYALDADDHYHSIKYGPNRVVQKTTTTYISPAHSPSHVVTRTTKTFGSPALSHLTQSPKGDQSPDQRKTPRGAQHPGSFPNNDVMQTPPKVPELSSMGTEREEVVRVFHHSPRLITQNFSPARSSPIRQPANLVLRQSPSQRSSAPSSPVVVDRHHHHHHHYHHIGDQVVELPSTPDAQLEVEGVALIPTPREQQSESHQPSGEPTSLSDLSEKIDETKQQLAEIKDLFKKQYVEQRQVKEEVKHIQEEQLRHNHEEQIRLNQELQEKEYQQQLRYQQGSPSITVETSDQDSYDNPAQNSPQHVLPSPHRHHMQQDTVVIPSPTTPNSRQRRQLNRDTGERNSVFTGQGVYRYTNGSKYEGEFLNGRRHGRGSMEYADGSTYSGDWYEDDRHGWGAFNTQHYTYEGEYNQDQKHGRGVIVYTNGEQYEGQWRNGLPEGTGQYQFKDGSVYLGHFSEGLRHGQGRLSYGDRCTIYEGDWFAGMIHFSHVNFVDKKHGRAKINFINGVYEGDMANDVKEGRGTYRYNNGDIYDGHWLNNKKHGSGIYIFNDGGSYKGKWHQGSKHGSGVLETHDGVRYAEKWSSGRLVMKKRVQ